MLAIGQGGLLGQLAEGDAYSEALMDRIGTAFVHSLVTEAQAGRARSGSKAGRRKELA